MTTPEKPQEDEQLAAAARLNDLFKRKSGGMSQEEFGAKFNIGTQGMMWQLLNGKRPLSLKAAVGFARGLDVTLEEISPRIAAEIRDACKFLAIAEKADSENVDSGAQTLNQGISEIPEYVDNVLASVVAAYNRNVPRDIFDAVRIILMRTQPNEKVETTHRRHAETEASKRTKLGKNPDVIGTLESAERRLRQNSGDEREERGARERKRKGAAH